MPSAVCLPQTNAISNDLAAHDPHFFLPLAHGSFAPVRRPHFVADDGGLARARASGPTHEHR